MSLRDSNFDTERKVMEIPIGQFTGIGFDGISLDASAPAVSEIGALGVQAMPVAASDVVYHTMEFPSDWDLGNTIGFRVKWTDNAGAPAAADAITFTVEYKLLHPDNVAEVWDITTGYNALDTAITSSVYGQTTALMITKSPRGIIAADTFSEADRQGTLGLRLTATTLTTISADEGEVFSLLIDYVPRYTTVSGVDVDGLIS